MQENRTPHTESKSASHIILHFHRPRRCPGLYPTVNQPFPLPSWFLSLLSSFFLLSYLLPSTHTKSLLLYRPCCLLTHTPSLSSNYLSATTSLSSHSLTRTHTLSLSSALQASQIQGRSTTLRATMMTMTRRMTSSPRWGRFCVV
jgi:hypothetical protein